MNRTRLLVALLVVVILLQVFPDRAGLIDLIAVIGVAAYALAWAAAKYVPQYRRTAARDAQEAADNEEYKRYRAELDVLRARYENRDWNDPAAIPEEYKEALNALHDKYQDMLTRKFGPRS